MIPLALLFVLLVAIGVLLGAASVYLLVTGRNLPGRFSRGFTPADDLRLARAPAAYWRALGGLLVSVSLLVLGAAAMALIGILWGMHTGVSPALNQVLLIILLVIVAGALFSTAWLVVIAARYRLFRWSKP